MQVGAPDGLGAWRVFRGTPIRCALALDRSTDAICGNPRRDARPARCSWMGRPARAGQRSLLLRPLQLIEQLVGPFAAELQEVGKQVERLVFFVRHLFVGTPARGIGGRPEYSASVNFRV